jgi:hypothetical protein
MSYVEVKNCGQKGTEKASVKFDGSTGTLANSIAHSSIHSGLAYGVYFLNSQVVTLTSNVIASHVAHGILA